MSKTLGAILTVGAAIAVNVIPVFGQIASAGIIGSATVGGALATAGLAAGFSVLTSALAPKAPKPQATEVPFKSPDLWDPFEAGGLIMLAAPRRRQTARPTVNDLFEPDPRGKVYR